MLDQDIVLWWLFVSAFISSTIAPGGSELLLVYLVSSNQHANLALIIIASLGNTLGALSTWWLGGITAKKFPTQKFTNKSQQKAIRLVKRWGNIALLFSWLPVLGDALCFGAGWLKLPPLSGSAAIATGKIIRYACISVLFI